MGKPAVIIAIITDNLFERYLLIRRAQDPFANYWGLISGIGASKKGLSPTEAVKDEVAYDIGAEFTGDLIFSYHLHQFDYSDTAFVFSGTVDQDQIQANPESVVQVRWFTYPEIKQLPKLAFDNEWLIEVHYSNLRFHGYQ